VGAQLPVSSEGVAGVVALDNGGSSLLIGWDGRETTALLAAIMNSSFIQGFELDDDHPLAPLHSNSLVIPGCSRSRRTWVGSLGLGSCWARSSAMRPGVLNPN
jgi:hypothetical protein